MALDLGVAAAVGGVFLVVVWPAGTADAGPHVRVGRVRGRGLAGLSWPCSNWRWPTGWPSPTASARRGSATSCAFGSAGSPSPGSSCSAWPAPLVGGLLAGGARMAASWAWRVAAAAVGLGVLHTLGAVGHSTAAGPLGMSARLVHLASVSVWLGGLFLLLAVVAPRTGRPTLAPRRPAAPVLPMAGGAVVTLASSGLAMALEIVGSPANLVTTPYGRTLALKSAIVAAVLVVASRSRAVVRERLVPVLSGGRGPPAAVAAAAARLATRHPWRHGSRSRSPAWWPSSGSRPC